MAVNSSSSLQTTLQSTLLAVEDLDNDGLNNAVGGPTKLLGMQLGNASGAQVWIKIEDSKLYSNDTMICVPIQDAQNMTISIDVGEVLDNGMVVYADTAGGSGKASNPGANFDFWGFVTST